MNCFKRDGKFFLGALAVTLSIALATSCSNKTGGSGGGGSEAGGSNPAIINVTGVTVAPASVSTVVGKQWILTATVKPANATDKSVTWQSSDVDVATVQAVAGKPDQAQVTTVKKGTATITVTTGNGKMAQTTIEIVDPVAVNSVTVADTSIVNTGKTVEIPIVINPSNTTYADITCTSSDETVFTVVADKNKKVCKVTTVDYGTSSRTATLTAKVTDENGTTDANKIQDNATITVTKPVDVTFVSLPNVIEIVGIAKKKDVEVTLDPPTANITKLTCSSDNETVFTVEKSDVATKKCTLISQKTDATANLTVKVVDENDNEKTATQTVTVQNIPPVNITSINFNSSSKREIAGNTETTQDEGFSISPHNGTPRTLECTSSDESVFTVTADLANKKCVVTTKAKGTATLTAKIIDLRGNVQTTNKTIEVYIAPTALVFTRKSDGKVLTASDITEITTYKSSAPFKVGTDADSDIQVSFYPANANKNTKLKETTGLVLTKENATEYKGAKSQEIKKQHGFHPYYTYTYHGYTTYLDYNSSTNKPVDGDVFYLKITSSSGLTAKVKFEVKIPVEKVALGKIAKPVLGGLKVGDSVTLSSVLYWGGSQNNILPQPGNTNVTYTSSNPSVIKITGNTAIAKAKGKTTITVTTEDGNKTATEDVWVFPADQEFTVSGVTFKMVSIPSRNLQFPTKKDNSGTARLSYGNHYWSLAETETTWGLYKKVRDWARNNGYSLADGQMGGDKAWTTNPVTSDEQPVTKISWCSAAVFANALTAYYNAHNGSAADLDYVYQVNYSELKSNSSSVCTTSVKTRDKNGFRLPTSNEWELAARWVGTDKGSRTDLVSSNENGGSYLLTYGYYWTPGSYGSGAMANTKAELTKVAWYNHKSTSSGSRAVSHKVKLLQANALGLYDMTGNVWEWHDTKDSSGNRCNSGGDYFQEFGANGLKIYNRTFVSRTSADERTGFRLARTIK